MYSDLDTFIDAKLTQSEGVRDYLEEDGNAKLVESLSLPTEIDQATLIAILGDFTVSLITKKQLRQKLEDLFGTGQSNLVDEIITKLETALPHTTEEPTIDTATMPQVTPMHTMADDVDKMHGYGSLYKKEENDSQIEEGIHVSDQDSVLKRLPVADTPQYSEGEVKTDTEDKPDTGNQH